MTSSNTTHGAIIAEMMIERLVEAQAWYFLEKIRLKTGFS
jgi:hypothetical protein